MASTSAVCPSAAWHASSTGTCQLRKTSIGSLFFFSSCHVSHFGDAIFCFSEGCHLLPPVDCKLGFTSRRTIAESTSFHTSITHSLSSVNARNKPLLNINVRKRQTPFFQNREHKWRVENDVRNINYDLFQDRDRKEDENNFGELLASVPLTRFAEKASENDEKGVSDTKNSVDEKEEYATRVAEREVDDVPQKVYDPQRLFVGNLPFKVPAPKLVEELYALFSKYGTVEDADVAIHRKQTQASRERGKHAGFAFVRMGSAQEAQQALNALHSHPFLGALLQVSPGIVKSGPHISRDPSGLESGKVDGSGGRYPGRRHVKLFVGGLYVATTEASLREIFGQYGKVVDVKIVRTRMTKKSLGIAFVTLHNAEAALKAMEDRDGSLLDGSIIKVNISQFARIT